MGAAFSYLVATGEHYHFELMDTTNYRVLPWSGAVVVFAEYTPEPLAILETPNLYGEIMNRRGALADRSQMLTYALIENDAKRRAEIVQDLLKN